MPNGGSTLLDMLAATALVGAVMAALLPALAQLQASAQQARQASSQWLGQTRALGWIQSQVRHANAMQVRGNRLTLWLRPGPWVDCYGDPIAQTTSWQNTFEVRGNSLRCASQRRLGAQPALDSVSQWRIQAVVAQAGQWQVLSGAAAQSVGIDALEAVRICLMEQANSACQTGINQQWMTPQPPTQQP